MWKTALSEKLSPQSNVLSQAIAKTIAVSKRDAGTSTARALPCSPALLSLRVAATTPIGALTLRTSKNPTIPGSTLALIMSAVT